MTTVLLPNRDVLLDHLDVASGFSARARGLMGRAPLPAGHGLYLPRCRCVHTFFMRFPLDLVFITREHEVVRVERTVKPWRICGAGPRAFGVIEVASGWLPDGQPAPGDVLSFIPPAV
jgi:uncharacterized membrane protein (UPF0127 family)